MTKRILLVDDDPNDVELTVAALSEHKLNAEIKDVADGAQALDYLHRRGAYAAEPPGHPSVILLDIKMPKVDGLTVLRRIRSDAKLWMIPIVMFTSSREERDLMRSYQLGANAYVVKPLEYVEFMDALKEVGVFWGLINEPPPDSLAPGELRPLAST
jgi:CheY-like chemotaxis protein